MITTRKLERQRRKYKITPPRKGDVFTIPLDDGRVHLGQVIAFERFDLLFYIVVFDLVTTPERAPDLVDRTLASRPILAGQTMDALFRPGGWKVVGNRPSDAARFLLSCTVWGGFVFWVGFFVGMVPVVWSSWGTKPAVGSGG